MNNELVKNKYKKKLNELIKHNQLYFEKNRPKISDNEYDKLKKEILDLEKKFKFLNHKKI